MPPGGQGENSSVVNIIRFDPQTAGFDAQLQKTVCVILTRHLCGVIN